MLDGKPLESACHLVSEQMTLLNSTGLTGSAAEFHVGINGGPESEDLANLFLPPKAVRHYHGLQCRNECRTIRMIEEWLPGHEDFLVFYFHTKCATHSASSPRFKLDTAWRDCMTRYLILRWPVCTGDLESGYQAVGCHWMEPPQTPMGQRIFAGNFFWARASYLRTLPSILARDRIRTSGLDSPESRYEAEVWIGNGKTRPRIKDYHGPWDPMVRIRTCVPL